MLKWENCDGICWAFFIYLKYKSLDIMQIFRSLYLLV